MTIPMRQDWVLMRMTQQTFSAHRINLHCTKAFLFRKLSNSSDLMKGKSNHVDGADFSSPLPAIIFSCKMRMERKIFYEEESSTTDTWCIVL
jgi:hypothetical protein